MASKLGKKLTAAETPIPAAFNRIRALLSRKLTCIKHDTTTSKLRFGLLELMPSHEDQRRLLPRLDIQIGDGHLFKLRMVVRKGNYRCRAWPAATDPIAQLELQIEELNRLRDQLLSKTAKRYGSRKKTVAILNALSK